MINTILEKALAELAKEKPDLSYLKGMLEVLLASQPQESLKPVLESHGLTMTAGIIHDKPQDEAAMMDAKAKASLETIKALAQVETE